MTTRFILAYLDAGSTSLLLAAVASGAAGLRLFLKSKLAGLRRSKDATSGTTDDVHSSLSVTTEQVDHDGAE